MSTRSTLLFTRWGETKKRLIKLLCQRRERSSPTLRLPWQCSQHVHHLSERGKQPADTASAAWNLTRHTESFLSAPDGKEERMNQGGQWVMVRHARRAPKERHALAWRTDYGLLSHWQGLHHAAFLNMGRDHWIWVKLHKAVFFHLSKVLTYENLPNIRKILRNIPKNFHSSFFLYTYYL